MRWLLMLMAFLLLAPANAVIINEIKPSSAEWLEIFNPANDILNLSSWLIKDNSTNNPDNITCWAILGCDLVTNTSYFLILGNSTNITLITNSSVIYYYTDDSAIGNGLTDSGDNITVYNNSFATSFNYTGSTAGKSWQRVPDGDVNITSCNPTPGMANACNTQNDSQDLPPDNASTITCDLSIAVNSTKLVYNSGESIDYDLLVNDNACSNITHPYTIQYQIEDLFGNYLRNPYNSSGTLTCSDAKSPTKQAPSLCGSEAYMIKAAIVQPYCNDTNASNNAAEQIIVVKGSNPSGTACQSSSSSSSSTSGSSKESPDFSMKISSALSQAHQGETIVTKFSLTNSYATARSFDVYSYVYSGQKLVSEGGWTGNKITLQVPAGDYVDASTVNKIKDDAEPGEYSLRVRAALGGEKADDDVKIGILQGSVTAKKTAEITSFYTRTMKLIAGNAIKLYANIKNLENENQTFELKLNNDTKTIMLAKKDSETFNFSVELPDEKEINYRLLLVQNSAILDEKNLTLHIEQSENMTEDRDLATSSFVYANETNVNWSAKSSANTAAILFSLALLVLSLSLLATAVSFKKRIQ